MSNDSISDIVKADDTIIQLGRRLYEAYEHTKEVEAMPSLALKIGMN